MGAADAAARPLVAASVAKDRPRARTANPQPLLRHHRASPGPDSVLVPEPDLDGPARRSEQQDQGPQPPRLRTPRHRVPRPPHPLHPRVPVQTHRNLTHAAEARHVKPNSTTSTLDREEPDFLIAASFVTEVQSHPFLFLSPCRSVFGGQVRWSILRPSCGLCVLVFDDHGSHVSAESRVHDAPWRCSSHSILEKANSCVIDLIIVGSGISRRIL